MSIPVTHPFWLALMVAAPVAVLSGLIVFLQAWRAITRVPEADSRLWSVRSTAGIAAGLITLGFGIVAGLAYGWLSALWPGIAGPTYLALGLGAAVTLSVYAVATRARHGAMVATVALNALWALGFGWLLPLVMQAA